MVIDQITFRELHGISVNDLDKKLSVNGGIVLISVDNQAKYVLSLPPSPLPNSPDGRHHVDNQAIASPHFGQVKRGEYAESFFKDLGCT